MQRLPRISALMIAGVFLASCSEGFVESVWDDEAGVETLSLYDGGAAWEERSVEEVDGERVVRDGLRFEGVFTESEDTVDVDVRCVSAENGSLATPCDTTVKRELACALDPEDEATLACTIGEEKVVLHRRGTRRITR